MSDAGQTDATPVVDAYMHVGVPRFGSADQALSACARWGTDKAVLVLGPNVPDITALYVAQWLRPDAFRAVGIPYGDTEGQRLECVEATLAVGAIGVRLQGDEPLENPAVMTLLGANGLWAYATDPLRSPRHTAFLLEWLVNYPTARCAAPHFLGIDPDLLETDVTRALLAHDRFYPILSRQGQAGSREPYPFSDLRPWVECLIARCGPRRMLWGSEYPVIYWRGEQINQTRRWLHDLGVSLAAEDYAAVIGGNAQRLFFRRDMRPALPSEMPSLPAWLQQYAQPGPVPLAPTAPVDLPMDVYVPLFDEYMRRNRPEAPIPFADYVVEQLRIRARELGKSRPDRYALCPLEE